MTGSVGRAGADALGSVSARVPATHERALRVGYDAGRAHYGSLALPFDAYAHGVLDRARRRLARASLEESDTLLACALERAHLGDLFLSLACDADVPGAWEAFAARVVPRVAGVAVRRGASATVTEEILADLPGALRAPPRDGGGRTSLGTYDGSGRLTAWLAVVVQCRVADRVRLLASRPSHLPPDAADEGRVRAEPRPAEQPLARLLDAEGAAAFRAAIDEGWGRLTEREALVLQLKHRQGVAQRRIAASLGVTESRVSRIVDAALAKLQEAMTRRFGAQDGAAPPASWNALLATLHEFLASSIPPHDSLGDAPPSHD